jgi:hypothetical protein
MRNFTNRAFAAKKKIYFVMTVCAACLFSSCAVGTYMPNSLNVSGTSTSVVLSQANFRVVRNVEVVVDINNTNLRRADAERSAFAELMRLYPLTGSQAYTNVVMEEVRRESMGFFRALIGLPNRTQHVALRATIIEFLQPNGEPIQSVQSPYAPQYPYQPQPQYQPQSNEGTNTQVVETIADLAKKAPNRYYIALLFKTKQLDNKKVQEKDLYNFFDYYGIKNLAQKNSEEDLKKYSKEHDKFFEQFAK